MMLRTGAAITLVLTAAALSSAQLTERPGHSLDDPVDRPRDLSGFSIKEPRVRVVHTTDASLKGGSLYLQVVDPWLGYQRGRNLTQREFRERDGVYGDAGLLDGLLLPDGASHIMSRSHVNSCGMCHNSPFRDGGAGATIAKNGGAGRNTPHLFGGGLVEMLGQQIRLKALAIADDNRDGWISMAEAAGKHCLIENLPEEVGAPIRIDYGRFDDTNSDGRPDLNELFHPIYVDTHGKRMAFARDLNFPGVSGYTIEVQAFGFGHRFAPFRPPVATTLRAFAAQAFDIHSGLQACDPTVLDDRDGDGFSQVSNAGALQCVTAAGRDRGAVLDAAGISHDDPDRDGFCHELAEGDLDLVEWYLLNHPAPARGRITPAVRRGEALFDRVGCIQCHVPDWRLHAANPGAQDYTQRFDGDRRFFELQVAYSDSARRLEGRLQWLADRGGDRVLPHRRAYTVRGIYADFKYHDLGPAFHQLQFDGTLVTRMRTTPLWGVGTTGPWGHDGASLTLDDVIRRHAGEALAARVAYAALSQEDQDALIDFLTSLVLYQTDTMPCDIDGDGNIAERFVVVDVDTGSERFNPEWLFHVPGRIEGAVVNVHGQTIVSAALQNARQAYGLDLPFTQDSDGDGFPDLRDPLPAQAGWRDGAK